MLAIAAMLILAVVIALWGAQVGSMVSRALCTITQQAVCKIDSGPSPYERALTGRYVALGDSFAAGEGAWDYEEGTDFDDRDDPWPFNDHEEEHNRCHRSANAYAQLLAAGNRFAGGAKFVACSGAESSDFNQPNDKETGEAPQFEALDDDVSLVTLSIGGNDVGFAKVLTACVVHGGRAPSSCREQLDESLSRKIAAQRSNLLAQYQQAKEKAKNARIIVVGYPPLFPENPSYRNSLTAEDQKWMNEKAAELNRTIASAAQEAGVEFVDPSADFAGHGIGSADPWFNELTFDGPGMMLVDPSSFHPNAKGQAAFAEAIQRQLEDPR